MWVLARKRTRPEERKSCLACALHRTGDSRHRRETLIYPVQLLRDGKGIYGIGVIEEPHCDILLRPDRLVYEKIEFPHAALQMITAARHRSRLFKNCREEWLRTSIHEEMLRRAGLYGDRVHPQGCDGTWGKFWSLDPKEQTKNRAKYHGLRRASVCVINRLIARALEEAADPEALKQARRFPLRHRYKVYRAGAISSRFLQLIAVFPVLALAILESGRDWNRLQAEHLVEIGAPLKKIASLVGVPMALRKVKPGAAHLALSLLEIPADPRLIHAYMCLTRFRA
jgi:hypothetical protein